MVNPVRKDILIGQVPHTLGVALVISHLSLAVMPPGEVRDVISMTILTLTALFALVGAFVALLGIRGSERRVNTAFLIAMFGFTLASVTRLWWAIAERTGPPVGSAEDLGYIIAIAALLPVVVMVGSPGRTTMRRRIGDSLDLGILLGISLALSWIVVLEPVGIVGAGVDVETQLIYSGYLVFGIGLVAYPLFRRDPWNAWARRVVIGLGLGAAYSLARILTRGNGYGFGTRTAVLVDTILVASLIMYGLACVWRVRDVDEVVYGSTAHHVTRVWLLFVASGLCLVGIPIVHHVAVVSQDEYESGLLASAVAIVLVLLVLRSILSLTEARRSNEFEESALRYQALAESTPSGILVVSLPERLIVYANPVAARMLAAATPYDLHGLHISDILPTTKRQEMSGFEELARTFLLDTDHPPAALPPAYTVIRGLTGQVVEAERTVAPVMFDGEPALLVQGQDVTARLRAERSLADYRDRLRELATRTAAVEDHERRVLATALHDQVGQTLAVARMRLALAQAEEVCFGPDAAAAMEMVDRAIGQTRMLTAELAPQMLYELGLEDAINWLAEQIGRSHSLRCEVKGSVDTKDLTEDRLSTLYRSSSELLMNVVKHANTDHAVVELAGDAEQVSIAVIDEGTGFVVGEIFEEDRHSFGLFSVNERVDQLGGELEAISQPGEGTTMTIRMPRS